MPLEKFTDGRGQPESRRQESGSRRRAHMDEGQVCKAGGEEIKDDRGSSLGLLGNSGAPPPCRDPEQEDGQMANVLLTPFCILGAHEIPGGVGFEV